MRFARYVPTCGSQVNLGSKAGSPVGPGPLAVPKAIHPAFGPTGLSRGPAFAPMGLPQRSDAPPARPLIPPPPLLQLGLKARSPGHASSSSSSAAAPHQDAAVLLRAAEAREHRRALEEAVRSADETRATVQRLELELDRVRSIAVEQRKTKEQALSEFALERSALRAAAETSARSSYSFVF